MEIFLIFCLIVVLVIRWVLLRDRMARMESRIAELTARVDAQSPAPPPRPQAVAPVVEPPRVASRGETPRVEPAPAPVALPGARGASTRTSRVACSTACRCPTRMGNHPRRKLAQQDRRVRAGGGPGAAAALFVHAIRSAGARDHLLGGELHDAGGGRDSRVERALPDLRARTVGRRLGGTLRYGLRDARGGGGARDRQPCSGRHTATGGGHWDDRALVALPLADGYRTGILRGLRHAGDHGHDFPALSGAGPAGGFTAVCGPSPSVDEDGDAGADRHLCCRRHSWRHRRAAMAGADHFRRLLVAV